MWVFLCRHQKRVFLFTNKTERNLEVTTKSGVAPKASDFGRVTTKTELTPFFKVANLRAKQAVFFPQVCGTAAEQCSAVMADKV